MKSMEILAPAGSIDILKNAIDAGADAVYFGGKTLNARRNADNFTRQETQDAVHYAHIRGKKVYITMNTIMYDAEIKEIAEEICFLAEVGVDALIVQDLGVIRLIREICPDMPIHASTQMSAHNVSDCRMLEAMGLSRVVLARELSDTEMTRIVRECRIETEVFVHGAMCMCVSGQCYFSSALGERSGNRGLCAQVCRLPFYVDDRNRHNLSLKDMSLIDVIPRLNEIGISSLKIEGRMKNAAYVSSVVTAFWEALNGKKYNKKFLGEVFSRGGFTKGYFENRLGADMFGVRSEEDKRRTSEVEADARQSITDVRKVPVHLYFSAKKNFPFRLVVNDTEGHEVVIQGDVCQQALNKAIGKEQIAVQLSKLGDTAYTAERLEGEAESELFLPLSSLNAVRRAACEELDQIRCFREPRRYHSYIPQTQAVSIKRKLISPKINIRLSGIHQLTEDLLQCADGVYLPLYYLRKADASLIHQYREKIGVELPRVSFEEESEIKKELQFVRASGISRAMCHTVGKLLLAKEAGFHITAGFGANIANSLALAEIERLGAEECVLSAELQFQRMKTLRRTIPVGIVAYGYFPLMITRNCPVKIESGCRNKDCLLTDRKGKQFRVACDNGVCEIFNSEAIYYADKREQLRIFDFILLQFTSENAAQCKAVLSEYQNGGIREGITRGTYMREIK